MEASALYCFAHAAGVRVLRLAHVTNTMGLAGDDFEKGEADGTRDALVVLETVATALRSPRSQESGKNQPGARRTDDRRVLSGIVHVLKTGCRWQDCPSV
jgi:hypothetical protein